MEIHELNTKTITNPAYVALDDGTDTYKLDLNAKLTLIDTALGNDANDIDALQSDVGTLSNLTTTAKNNVVDAINEVDADVSDLKSDISLIEDSMNPILYGIQLANGKWGASGTPNYYASVKSGDIVRIKANTSYACYYAVLKSLDGMTTGTTADFATGFSGLQGVGVNTEIYITIPSDAKILYVFEGDTRYIPAIFERNGYNLLTGLTENIDELFARSKYLKDNSIFNAYVPSELISGYIINYSDGAAITNQYTSNYACTDYIPVEYGDIIHLAYVRGKDLCGGALYDSNHTFIKPIWGTDSWLKPSINVATDFTFVVDDRKVAYLRYNVQDDSVFKRVKQYLWITKSTTYQKIKNNFIVGSGEKYTSLKSVFDYINDNKVQDATVFVKPGTYDLVSEFGQSYLDSLSISSNIGVGIHIGNGTHLIFAEGAKVKFLYNGNNTSVCEYFSAFNVMGSCIIENADIEVANARYCVHEDLPTSVPTTETIPSYYTAIYKNCVMKHNGNTAGSYTGTVCIGGGCMPNGVSIIEGGKYTCGTQYPRAISYHNYNKSQYGNYPSKVVLKNVWINNALRLGVFSDSVVDVEISGCYVPNGIYDGSSTYFNITKWNNVGIS